MIQALYTSITGMKAYQEALSVTSNNIANAQTTGFKKQKAVFDDLLYKNATGSKGDDQYAGTNPVSVGSGVKLSGVNTDYTAGSVTLTNGKTDVALEGSGFFLLGDINAGSYEYTRKGTFSLSDDSRLVNSEGKYVLGYPVDTEGVTNLAANPSPIQVEMGNAIGGEVTTTATVSGNLPTDEDSATIQFPMYDEAGNKLVMQLTYEKISDNNYTYTATIDGNAVQFQDADGNLSDTATLSFNTNGTLNTGAQSTVNYNGGLTLNLDKITNYPTDETLSVTDINGRQAAVATDYSITDSGYVMIEYSDGSLKPYAQLAVATFPNEKGLMKTGNGNYTIGPSAGEPVLGVSGQNGAGTVRGGATEGSNVDLSSEFVDLMVYQKGFQGNSKVIKVADEVLDDIVNLIR